MTYICGCTCHRTCHTCGRPFRGPQDFHINCGDIISADQTHNNYGGINSADWPGTWDENR